ncbi:MAG: hypothetical protein ACPGJS_18155 [Flammeovirgaceae bacterium]
MSNTLKIILGLVVGLVVVSFVWKGIKMVFFLALALGVGYFILKSVFPKFLGKANKDEAEF